MILDEIDLTEDVFAPLTKIATTLYLLGVKQDGKLIGELKSALSLATIDQEIEREHIAVQPVSDPQPIFARQLTGEAAQAFLDEVKQRYPAPEYPHIADGRPRALLPDELITRLKASPQRTLQPTRSEYYEAWSDDTLMLMKAKGYDRWVARSTVGDGEYRPLPLTAHSTDEFVQGATLFEALDALREHLAAWWGLVPKDTRISLRPRNPAWEVMSIRELLEIVNTREIVLIADEELGIPTIHDQPHPEHMGFGTFCSQTAEYAVNWDAGGSMNRLLNGQGWTDVHVEWGTFPYDKTRVTQTLERWITEFSGTPDSAHVQPAVNADERSTAYAQQECERLTRAVETARDKEPWQMTRDEFLATQRPIVGGARDHLLLNLIVIHEHDVAAQSDNEGVSAGILKQAVDYLDQLRQTLVHIALAELKPVPDEVLHDFPELAAKYAKCRAEESAPRGEAVGVLACHKVAQVEAAGYRFVFGEMDEAAKDALVGLGAGRGSKLDMLRAKHLTVEKVTSATEPIASETAAKAAPGR